MSRAVRFSVAPFVLLGVLFSGACNQNETSEKASSGIEKSVSGSWVEGTWNPSSKEQALPEFQLSGEKITLGQCAFSVQSLLSHDEKHAYIVLKRGSACPIDHAPGNVVLTQSGHCQAQVDMYVSTEDIHKGSPEHTGMYSKSGCSEAAPQ